jgi:hypothetical protein
MLWCWRTPRLPRPAGGTAVTPRRPPSPPCSQNWPTSSRLPASATPWKRHASHNLFYGLLLSRKFDIIYHMTPTTIEVLLKCT